MHTLLQYVPEHNCVRMHEYECAHVHEKMLAICKHVIKGSRVTEWFSLYYNKILVMIHPQ